MLLLAWHLSQIFLEIQSLPWFLPNVPRVSAPQALQCWRMSGHETSAPDVPVNSPRDCLSSDLNKSSNQRASLGPVESRHAQNSPECYSFWHHTLSGISAWHLQFIKNVYTSTFLFNVFFPRFLSFFGASCYSCNSHYILTPCMQIVWCFL